MGAVDYRGCIILVSLLLLLLLLPLFVILSVLSSSFAFDVASAGEFALKVLDGRWRREGSTQVI